MPSRERRGPPGTFDYGLKNESAETNLSPDSSALFLPSPRLNLPNILHHWTLSSRLVSVLPPSSSPDPDLEPGEIATGPQDLPPDL